jgi:hypothetical protein
VVKITRIAICANTAANLIKENEDRFDGPPDAVFPDAGFGCIRVNIELGHRGPKTLGNLRNYASAKALKVSKEAMARAGITSCVMSVTNFLKFHLKS